MQQNDQYLRIIIVSNLLTIFITLFTVVSYGQQSIVRQRPIPQHLIVMQGDTLAYDILPILPVGDGAKEYWANYYNAELFVPKIYYYVVLAEELLKKYDSDMALLNGKKARKKYMKKANKELKKELGEDIRKMSEIRGRFLIQLLYRQTQKRAYDIIAEYRGEGTAKLWQGISRLGGANLKLTYDAYGKDSFTEIVVRDIESGKLAYEDHTPKTQTGKEVMENRRKRRKKSKRKSNELAKK